MVYAFLCIRMQWPVQQCSAVMKCARGVACVRALRYQLSQHLLHDNEPMCTPGARFVRSHARTLARPRVRQQVQYMEQWL